MKWSWKLGEMAGIGVHMHATFLLLIGWVALGYWIQEQTLAAVLSAIGFIWALFACVVLHEFGHIFTARKYGFKTREIMLLPIGGVARMERMPGRSTQELWVALAGPAVNVVIAAILFLWMQLTAGVVDLSQMSITSGSFLERLMIVNLSLVGINMIPALPMDGGRILCVLLAKRLDYTQATQIAAWLGQGLALLLGFIGIFANPFLLFIAVFVWIGATQESGMAQMKSALSGLLVGHAMLTNFRTLHPNDSLALPVELIFESSHQDFPVVSNGHLVGVLTLGDLLAGLAKRDPNLRVTDVMRRDFRVAGSDERLEVALARLQDSECRTLPVTRSGQLVGLVTKDRLGKFLLIQATLGEAKGKMLLMRP